MGPRLNVLFRAHVLTIAVMGALALVASRIPLASAAELQVRGSRARLDVKKLDALVHLELGSRAQTARVVVTFTNANSADVSLDVDDDHPRGTVDLSRSPDVERTLALFVGELARKAEARPPSSGAPRSELVNPSGSGAAASALADGEDPKGPVNGTTPSQPLQNGPIPPVQPTPAIVPRKPVATRDPLPRGLFAHALAAMGARGFGSGGAWILTPHIEGGLTIRDALRLGVIARYGYASANDSLGSVSAHAASGGLAASLRVASGGRLSAWTGPRIEAGAIAGRGEGVGGASATAPQLSGAWAVEAHAAFGNFYALGALEGGWLGRGLDLRADDRSVLKLSGAFVGASIGLGIR